MNKERRLGRGLEALLGLASPASAPQHPSDSVPAGGSGASAASSGSQPQGGLQTLSIHQIERNPYQPRTEFPANELQQLAESLATHGLLQPLVVRKVNERYQLVSGERRLRAAMLAGWADVPVHMVDVGDRESAELALVENLQRKDLSPLEKAASFQSYLRQYGCTQEQLASRLQLDRSTVANLIRLLDLPEAIQSAIRSGQITAGHGRALLSLENEADQMGALHEILQANLSVRGAEQLVQSWVAKPSENDQPLAAWENQPPGLTAGETRNNPGRGPGKTGTSPAHLRELEQQLKGALGTGVTIQTGRRGGKIIIQFKSHEEFERLTQTLLENAAPQKRRAA